MYLVVRCTVISLRLSQEEDEEAMIPIQKIETLLSLPERRENHMIIMSDNFD